MSVKILFVVSNSKIGRGQGNEQSNPVVVSFIMHEKGN